MPVEKSNEVAIRSADGVKELGEVTVAVARPRAARATAVMAHGAGGDMNSRLLLDLQERLVKRSLAVVRFNFLYTENGRRAPDRRPVLEACWRSVADWVRRELEPERMFLGGKSMGGRMCSYLAADGYPCRGVFFLGYPLHPPGKTEKLRKEHLPRMPVPMLFIQGTRDSLCKLDLLNPILKKLGAKATLHVIDGGDHSFRVPKRMGKSQSDVVEEIAKALTDWIESLR